MCLTTCIFFPQYLLSVSLYLIISDSHPSIHPSNIHPSTHPPTRHLSVYPSIHHPVWGRRGLFYLLFNAELKSCHQVELVEPCSLFLYYFIHTLLQPKLTTDMWVPWAVFYLKLTRLCFSSNKLAMESLWLNITKFLFNNYIEIKLVYHKIHPFKAHN